MQDIFVKPGTKSLLYHLINDAGKKNPSRTSESTKSHVRT